LPRAEAGTARIFWQLRLGHLMRRVSDSGMSTLRDSPWMIGRLGACLDG
jgi:hypothetical protein